MSEKKRLVLTHDPDMGCGGCPMLHGAYGGGEICVLTELEVGARERREAGPDDCPLRVNDEVVVRRG